MTEAPKAYVDHVEVDGETFPRCVPTLKRNSSRPRERTFANGRTEKGYEIVADGAAGLGWGVLGFAVQNIDPWGRKRGWYVLDYTTGEVILGLGASTRIGFGLGECLFMFADHLIASRSGE